MSLADMIWKRVSVHRVVAEFLRNEPHRLELTLSPASHARLAPLIASPNLGDPAENHARLRLLYLIRRPLIGEIPPDTQWHEVHNLTDNELAELHVIAHSGWDAPGQDRNELLQVAARMPRTLSGPPSSWPPPILWGHSKAGPFTIIEGNNRLTAYAAASPRPRLAIPVLVGVSPTPCFFHIFDPTAWVANDLWK
jgi:hypothetical protein